MVWIEIAVVVIVAVAATSIVLLASERKARRRFQVLGEVVVVDEAGESLADTFEGICEVLVPGIADFCMIDVFDDGAVRRAAVRVAPGGPPGAQERLAERRPSVPADVTAGEAGSSPAPRFFERMTEADLRSIAHDPEDLEFLRSLRIRSAVTVVLRARGKVTGLLTLGVAWSGRRFRRDDAHFAWILSGRVGLALDNAGLFSDLERAERARAEIGETLQRGLLPPPLPSIPGWTVAAMYRPAGAENEVGGDFYDVFRVARGWMLVVGDVTGRGARAASVTAVARYTLRTAAALTADPLVALAALNRALLARGDAALCSVVALVLSEDPDRPVRLAVAGHPPPMLVKADGIAEIGGEEPVLGAFPDARWSIESCAIEPGQQLVVVTDGIIESVGPDGRFGEERVREQLRGASSPAMALSRLESSLNAFTDGNLVDDVAILAMSRAPGGVEADPGQRELGSPTLAATPEGLG
jgi:hypothetical protein